MDPIKDEHFLFSKRLTKNEKVSCLRLRNLDAIDVRQGRRKVVVRRAGLFGLLPFLIHICVLLPDAINLPILVHLYFFLLSVPIFVSLPALNLLSVCILKGFYKMSQYSFV